MVERPLAKILYNPKEVIKYVYFPRRAAVSMVNIFEDGSIGSWSSGAGRYGGHFAVVRR
jgi:hypothetical protein